MAGMHDFLFGKGGQAGAMVATDPAPQLPEVKHPTLSFLLGGRDGLDSGRQRVAEQQALTAQGAMRQQAMAAAKQLFPDNGQLQILAAAKPDVFFSTIAEYQKPQKASQGDLIQYGMDGPSVYNKKTGMDSGIPYSQDAEGVATYGQQRPMSYTETETAAQNQRQLAQQQAVLQEQIRNNNMQHQVGMGNVGVAQGNLGLSRQRFNGSGGGGLDGMTTDQLTALARTLK